MSKPPRSLHGGEALASLVSSRTFDVVVVGGGGSGAVAAIEATERGASVLILEKADTPGGSTQESGGTIRTLRDPHGAAEHYWNLTGGSTPREVMEAFAVGLMEIPAWIEAHGGRILMDPRDEMPDSKVFPIRRPGTAFPGVPGGEALGGRGQIAPSSTGRANGAALWDFLAANLARLDIPLVTGARVSRLLDDDQSRAVTGVEVEHPDGSISVAARRAVILTCGGFAWDREMTRQYFGHSLPALSPPWRNTGDGIRMAQHVGADLWHMTAGAASVGYQVPEFPAAFQCQMPDYGFVMVDQRARRYTRETEIEGHAAMFHMMKQASESGEFIRIPSYVIFDERTRAAGKLAKMVTGENRDYPWSEGNLVEIERGWFKRAASIEELARQLDLPGDELTQTIEAFNAAARGERTDAERRPQEEMRPISEPPYYGATVYPTLLNTQGGPRRNADAAIVRPDGTAIPGLFSAGELGSIWDRLYPGAGNITEVLVFGRIAGRNAAATPPLAEGDS